MKVNKTDKNNANINSTIFFIKNVSAFDYLLELHRRFNTKLFLTFIK
mgnify:CR=1 FL=1